MDPAYQLKTPFTAKDYYKLVMGDYEFNRLKPIFDQPFEESAFDFAAPVLSDDHRWRTLVICGIGSYNSLVRAILKHQDQVKTFIFIENNPKVVAHLMNHPKIGEVVTSARVRLLFMQDEKSLASNLFRALKQPHISDFMELACVCFNEQEANPVDLEFYKNKVESIYAETCGHVFHNYGRIDDSLEGIRATFANANRLDALPGIQDLRGRFKGVPALLVSAGPSLDQELQELRKAHDRFLILAVDAAVKPLLSSGITPHFTTSIERSNLWQKAFWKGLPKDLKTNLVCYPVVHPEVLDLYPGPMRMVYRNYSYYAYFENNWPKGILHSGGSTAHLAHRLAHYMGCSEIILVGIDSSYEPSKENKDLFRSHCNKVGYEDWSSFKSLEDFHLKSNHMPAFEAEANDGSKVWTNQTYYQWIKEFSEEIGSLNTKVTTTSAKGVKGYAIDYKPFKDIIDSYPPLPPITIPAFQAQNRKKWEHKVLKRSVKGWLRRAKEAAELCRIVPLTPDLKTLCFLTDFYKQTFTLDDLFVSFIIQNCAAEFYHLQNDYHALSFEALEDYGQKIKLYQKRFTLFTEVLEKLDQILESQA